MFDVIFFELRLQSLAICDFEVAAIRVTKPPIIPFKTSIQMTLRGFILWGLSFFCLTRFIQKKNPQKLLRVGEGAKKGLWTPGVKQDPEIPKKHRVYTNFFEKFARTFAFFPVMRVRNPTEIVQKKKLVQMNFFILGGFFRVDFPPLIFAPVQPLFAAVQAAFCSLGRK